MINKGQQVSYSNRFNRDLKKYRRKDRELKLIKNVVELLVVHGAYGLPKNMRVHKLLGKYEGFWECHILPDLLLIWEEVEDDNIFRVSLIRIGSHSELF